jgi:hypothetical protein
LVQKARRAHHAFLHEVFGSVLVDRDLSDLVRITGRLDASIATGNLPE